MALLLALCLCLLASCSATGWRRELTTRSYDSLGFHENIYHSPAEDQIIIAVLDTGIWPESPSFRDDGLGPPPAKWKGICDSGNSYIPFKCNNKIIGARMYHAKNPSNLPEGEELSPRDMDGHGTHCAATVAGVPVRNVSVQGVGQGTARGAVPRARIAVYKVCAMQFCSSFANVQAMKDALHDGVDIISISIAVNGGLPYMNNDEAYISLEATILGVLVSYGAANNSTLEPYTVSNSYPWVATVANSAGSGTDYVTYVTLGDGKRFEGTFMNDKNDTTYTPLVRIDEVTNATDPQQVSNCAYAFVKPELVKGKIIICPFFGETPWDWDFEYLGCAGLIINGEQYVFEGVKDNMHFLNTTRATVTILTSHDFKYLQQYYNKSISIGQTATALIEKTVAVPDTAPRTVLDSSRGPSLSDINILKPDISAPGVNQIDAVSGRLSLPYNLKSGTSMSTPFLSGVAAYVRSLHPTWSASAIKSALMTTASPMTDDFSYAGPLAYGSGQVSPLKAADPGLVYDIRETDYVKYLCHYANFSSEWVNKFRRRNDSDCANFTENGWTLNYPSFAVPVVPNQPFVSVFKRTLTNVANSSISNYKVIVSAPRELTVKIDPSVLVFTQVGQALSYTLTVSGQLVKSGKEITIPNLVATVVWTDGIHEVKSPISVFEAPADYDAQFLKTHGFRVEEIFHD